MMSNVAEHVSFVLPGLIDNVYSLHVWWIFGYLVYYINMSACILMVDSWSFMVSLFFGNFGKSYLTGAKMCNRMVAQIWKWNTFETIAQIEGNIKIIIFSWLIFYKIIYHQMEKASASFKIVVLGEGKYHSVTAQSNNQNCLIERKLTFFI